MIDLHSHILPGLDDGSPDLSTSLDMARAAAADGVMYLACTPHILPGLYHNTGEGIRAAVLGLQNALDAAAIPLRLVVGADAHIGPDMVDGLRQGRILSINDSRYVLVEPPHHVMPARLTELFFTLSVAGYVPILTHPERLSWIKGHYDTIVKLIDAGAWMQITAGSLVGAFGRSPLYWAERMLDEGRAHIIASDAHDLVRRPPLMRAGFEAAAKRVGDREAETLVWSRPWGILSNDAPFNMPAPVGALEQTAHGRSTSAPVVAGPGSGFSPGRLVSRLRECFR